MARGGIGWHGIGIVGIVMGGVGIDMARPGLGAARLGWSWRGWGWLWLTEARGLEGALWCGCWCGRSRSLAL